MNWRKTLSFQKSAGQFFDDPRINSIVNHLGMLVIKHGYDWDYAIQDIKERYNATDNEIREARNFVKSHTNRAMEKEQRNLDFLNRTYPSPRAHHNWEKERSKEDIEKMQKNIDEAPAFYRGDDPFAGELGRHTSLKFGFPTRRNPDGTMGDGDPGIAEPEVEPDIEPDIEPGVEPATPAEPNRSPFRRPDIHPDTVPRPKAHVYGAVRYNPEFRRDRMNPSLQQAIEQGKTPFHGNASVPGPEHIEDVASKRFEGILRELKNRTGIDTPSKLYGKIKNIKRAIQELEADHKQELEQLAVRLVEENWGLNAGEVRFEPHLAESGEISHDKLVFDKPQAPPIPQTQMPEAQVDEQEFKSELSKRRMVNSLIQGSATKAKSLFYLAQDELNAIDPGLIELYKLYIPLVSLGWWVKPVEREMSGLLGGLEELDLSEEVPTIKAQGTTFITLLSELIKGTMELVSLHGAPKDPTMYQKVLDEADTVINERWDLRFGPEFWDNLLEAMSVEDPRVRATIYEKIVSLPVNEFHALMQGVLQKNPQATQKIQDMLNDLQSDTRTSASITPERRKYLRNRDWRVPNPNPYSLKLTEDPDSETGYRWERIPNRFHIDTEDFDGIVDTSYKEYAAGYNVGYIGARSGFVPDIDWYLEYAGTDAYEKGKIDGEEDFVNDIPNRYSSLRSLHF